MKGFVVSTVKKKKRAQFSGNLGGPNLRRWANSWRWWVCKTHEPRGQNWEVTESCFWLPLTSIPTLPASIHFLLPLLPSFHFFHFPECLPCIIVVFWEVQNEKTQCFHLETYGLMERWPTSQYRCDFSVMPALRQEDLGPAGRRIRGASRGSEKRLESWMKNRCLLGRW